MILLSACTTPPLVRTYAPGELRDEYTSARDDLFPEGATFDGTTRSFFVGSLAHGDITRISVDGKESVFHRGPVEPGRATLGMAVDERARRLWVCAIRDKKTQAGAVWAFDIESGRRTHHFTLGTLLEGASCSDVAVDGEGAAYVTDRLNPVIYRLTADDVPPTIWARHPLLAPERKGTSGIAITPDGSTLLVTRYDPAALLRISMADPREISEVTLRGDAFSGGPSVGSGADGLRFSKGVLYVAFDRWVMRVVNDDQSWKSASVKAKPISMKYGVTSLTEVDGALYASNGQTALFWMGLDPALPFRLVRLDPTLFDEK